MIIKNKNPFYKTFFIVLPYFKAFKNSEKLINVHFVSNFSKNYFV